MTIREIITANCENGQLSKSKIARQWDDQGTLIQFAGYPEPETDEELIFRLIVWMRASEDAEPVELPPIELEADRVAHQQLLHTAPSDAALPALHHERGRDIRETQPDLLRHR